MVGFVLLAVGLGVLAFIVYVIITQGGEISSPVPDQKGVKVIYITPGSQR